MSDFNPYQAPSTELPEAPNPADNPEAELASRWLRLGASIIDGLISSVLTLPIMFLSGYWGRAMAGNTSVVDAVGLQLVGIVVFMALHGYLLAKSGQTIGKKLLNIQVVSHSNGQILSLAAITGKRVLPVWLIALIPYYVGMVVGIVNVLMIFRQDRRCLHDLIADTKVIVVQKLVNPAPVQ